MTQLIIHIGPPKTASTSLQYFFQNIESSKFIYLGTLQPREINGDLYGKLISDIRNNCKRHYQEVSDALAGYFSMGKNVVISEELLSMKTNDSSVLEILDNTLDYFSQFNPVILYVVRDPTQVIPSFYQQIYNELPSSFKKHFDKFVTSDFCDTYKYNDNIEHMFSKGVARVIVLSFDNLVSNKYYLSDIFEPNEIETDSPIVLNHQNFSPKSSKDNFKEIMPITFKLYVSNLISSIPKPKFLKGSRLSSYFINSLPNLSLGKVKTIQLNFNSNIFDDFKEQYAKVLNNYVKVK